MSTVTFGTLHARELFAPVLPVVKAVSDDLAPLRYARVLITPDNVHVYATDRYVLVESRQSVNNEPGEMFVPLDALTVLAKVRGAEYLTYTVDGGKGTLTLASGQSWTFDVPQYPAIERVADKLTGAAITDDNWPFSVYVPVMDTLLKVCKAAGKHVSPVFQHVPGDNRTGTRSDALAVRVTDDVRMLCMPSRLTGDTLGTELFPGWRSLSDVATEVKLAVSAA